MGLIPFILLISLNTLMLLKLKAMAEERRMSDQSGVSQVTIIKIIDQGWPHFFSCGQN
jgi:hypothetical protein